MLRRLGGGEKRCRLAIMKLSLNFLF